MHEGNPAGSSCHHIHSSHANSARKTISPTQSGSSEGIDKIIAFVIEKRQREPEVRKNRLELGCCRHPNVEGVCVPEQKVHRRRGEEGSKEDTKKEAEFESEPRVSRQRKSTKGRAEKLPLIPRKAKTTDIFVSGAASAHQEERTVPGRRGEGKLPLVRQNAHKPRTRNPTAEPSRVSIGLPCLTAIEVSH